jgi:hypothetical protein
MKVHAVRGGGGLRLHVREWRKVDGLPMDGVRPGVQVSPVPLLQSARLSNRIPEVIGCLDRPTPQVNDHLAVRHRSG